MEPGKYSMDIVTDVDKEFVAHKTKHVEFELSQSLDVESCTEEDMDLPVGVHKILLGKPGLVDPVPITIRVSSDGKIEPKSKSGFGLFDDHFDENIFIMDVLFSELNRRD